MKKIAFIMILMFAIYANGHPQSADLIHGLIAYYPFSGNASDESGNGYNGTIYEANLTTDRFNNPNSAYYFNGINSKILINFEFGGAKQFTASVWTKTTDKNGRLFGGEKLGSTDFNLFLVDGKISSSVYFSGVQKSLFGNLINDDHWHHCVISYDGKKFKLFLDTKLQDVQDINGIVDFLGFGYYIGARNIIRESAMEHLNGNIDDVRFYNRALNENEIQALFKFQNNIKVYSPTITWKNPSTYNSVSKQENYKIKACIKSKKQLSALQIYADDILYKDVIEADLNITKSSDCDFLLEQDILLKEGNNKIKIIAANQGGSKTSEIRMINYQPIKRDIAPPIITLIYPKVSRGFKIIEESEQINIIGEVKDESGVFKLTVNGTNAYVSSDQKFQSNVLLGFGDNTITIKATDVKQNTSDFTFIINRTNQKITINNEKRIALVIGNADYSSAPLKNPVNDAITMSTELKALGFEVTTITNGSQNQMKQAISNFGTQLSKDKNTVGLFYYAGHGLQVKGKNYIIPTDANIEKEPDVEVFCVDLDGLLANLEYAGNNLNVIILDACRNNPYSRGFRSQAGNGLATVNPPSGTFIAFATAPGSIAADGEGENGLYTQEFVKAIQIPNIKIEDVFKKVRTQVKSLSNGQQIPWENSSIEGDFYFKK